jgi:hypothetical protein
MTQANNTTRTLNKAVAFHKLQFFPSILRLQDSITSFATRRTPGVVGEAAVQDEEGTGEIKGDTGSGIEEGSSKPMVEDNTPTVSPLFPLRTHSHALILIPCTGSH